MNTRGGIHSDSNSTWRARIESWSTASAFVIAALFLTSSLLISSRRMFWFDEVFTTFITRLPDWAGMWRSVASAADPTPFGYLAIARISDHLFGPGEIGIRLPSAIAVTIGLVVTFFCTRRVADGLHGLISIALLLCSFLPFYASEGRAYGLCFLFSALALWCWFQRAAFALGAVIFCGLLIHYYVIFCMLPLAAAEALDWRLWKPPSRSLLAGIVGAFLAFVIQLPQILVNQRKYGTSLWWGSPTLSSLKNVYEDMFPDLPFLLALILTCFAIFAAGKQNMPVMSAGERVGWLFLLIPPAGFVCAALVTNAFAPRYFIGILPGVTLAFASLIYRALEDQPRVSALICTLLLGFGSYKVLAATLHPELIYSYGSYQPEVREVLQNEDRIRLDGKKFILMPHLLVLPVRYYSKHPERYMRLMPDPPPKKTLIPSWTSEAVVEQARETAFVDPDPGFLAQLRMARLRLSVQKLKTVVLVYAE